MMVDSLAKRIETETYVCFLINVFQLKNGSFIIYSMEKEEIFIFNESDAYVPQKKKRKETYSD